ncbi:MAG TPA: DUF4337 domain-containing protein [Pyrinomonadaceae bacterium]|nr:DUF4337 domain-containing protein [Pyrinomonadaceae bacterium]
MEASDAAEQIVDAKEKGDEKFKGRAALIIGFMAMLLAITSLGGGNVLEDMIAHNIHASDTWAFYQAKTIRQTTVRTAADDLEVELKTNPNMPADARQVLETKINEYRKTAERYDDEPDKADPGNPLKGEGRKQLMARARDFEAQREIAQKKDPNFDFAEALFQIAIVLASVSILATSRRILQFAVIAGFAATLLMINGYFLLLPNLL